MSAAQFERIQEHLQRLRLFKSRERLEALLQEASTQELSYADFLDQVLTEEVTAKTAKHITMRTSLARFPSSRVSSRLSLATSPRSIGSRFRRSVPAASSSTARMSSCWARPVSGKRIWRSVSGLKAIEHGYRVFFTTAAAMLTTLSRALSEGRLEDKLKVFTVPRLLIIDEIGYLPIDGQGANRFFQLISRRYERGPMILTSNQSFGSWGDVFGDRVIASAILDRVLHHSITVNIKGDSYRLREKLKAGLLKPKTPIEDRSETETTA